MICGPFPKTLNTCGSPLFNKIPSFAFNGFPSVTFFATASAKLPIKGLLLVAPQGKPRAPFEKPCATNSNSSSQAVDDAVWSKRVN